MPRRARWKRTATTDGYSEYHLLSYRYFYDLITKHLMNYKTNVFRGHRRDDWKLEPTLDRLLRNIGKAGDLNIRGKHLVEFKYAVRGRRGPNPAQISEENDWWSLGQHHGLCTPLLDWTASAFVAAYFAYCSEEKSPTGRRCVFGLSRISVDKMSKELKSAAATTGANPETLDFYQPLSDENARLVSQSGLFTRTPDGVSIEHWIKKH